MKFTIRQNYSFARLDWLTESTKTPNSIMKFAEHLSVHTTPEWRAAYINYEVCYPFVRAFSHGNRFKLKRNENLFHCKEHFIQMSLLWKSIASISMSAHVQNRKWLCYGIGCICMCAWCIVTCKYVYAGPYVVHIRRKFLKCSCSINDFDLSENAMPIRIDAPLALNK